MEELKKCPFCGGEAKLTIATDEYEHYSWYCVSCDCGAAMESEATTEDLKVTDIGMKKVVAAWNRRADGWIAVSERLPEAGDGIVLVCAHNEGGKHVVDTGVYLGNVGEWFVDWHTGKPIVTHWMPLPSIEEINK